MYEYFLAEDSDFARLFRLPAGSDGPVEIYDARNLSWQESDIVKVRANLKGTLSIPDVSALHAEMRVCQLMVRAAKRFLDSSLNLGILTRVSSHTEYVNN